MSGVLLDTNVLSELRRPKPDKNVVKFISNLPLETLFVSSVTFAEIRFGIEILSDAAKRSELIAWLDHQLRPMFENRVLSVTEDTMFLWRVMVEEGRKSGHTYSQPDLIIAATARQHGLTVASRDISEFERANVPVINPWKKV